MFEATGVLDYPAPAPEKTAVVVIDMIRHQITAGEGAARDLSASGIDTEYFLRRVNELVIPQTAKLIDSVRRRGGLVVYARLAASRPDFRDASRHMRPAMLSWAALENTPATEVVDELRPCAGDIDLMKSGSGAFHTSDLDSRLRNAGIESVFYTGVVTNCCVLLTVAAGFDLGYFGYLVSDATATFNDRLQHVTEEPVGGYLARVMTVNQLIDMLEDAQRDASV